MDGIALALLALALGLAVGLTLGWAWAHRRTRLTLDLREAAWQAELQRVRGEAGALLRDRDQLRAERDDSKALEARLEPLRATLESLRQQSIAASHDRARADAAIQEQLRGVRSDYASLSDATGKLVVAMSSGTSRGQWGEMQLERLLEHSGLVEGVHFRRQDTRSTDHGASRPDVVVVMPGGTEILIDAKFPFDAYWDAINGPDTAQSSELMRKHAADVLARVRELASKRYSDISRSPDFVIMFLPLESLLQEAMGADGQLLEKSFQANVVLATPTSLLAMLRTIAFGYQRNDLARNAERIQQIGADLLGRLGVLSEHLDRMRRGLEQAAKGYNDFVSSYETRVLVSARQMRDLGASTTRSLEAPPGIDDELRLPRGQGSTHSGSEAHIDDDSVDRVGQLNEAVDT